MVHLLALLSAIAVGPARVAGGVAVPHLEVYLRGEWRGVPDGGPVRFSAADAHHRFRFAARGGGPFRYRYRLDGRDSAWRATQGMFRMEVRFLDSVGQMVTNDQVFIPGTSPGWSGAHETSTLTPHRHVATAPPKAAALRVAFLSGGPPREVGLLAVRELKVTRLGPGPSGQVTLMETRFDEGERLDEPNGVPRGWQREGSSGTIAQLLPPPGGRRRVSLALVDTDPERWGAWATSKPGLIPVEPGERLAIEWLGVYSEGTSGPGEADYASLPAGSYRFRVQALRAFGDPAGPEASWGVEVRPPFWQTPWFLGLGAAGVTAGMAWLARHLTRRHMQGQLAQSEQKAALERERARIARDLHDHLGANLTQIALLSELAQADLDAPDQACQHLNQIFTTAHGLARQLEEIVWAINPANDSLDHLADYLCKFSQEFLSAARIACRFDVPPTIPSASLSVLERHNVFLATKESLHNVVKHAEASEVWLRLAVTGGDLRIDIEDNGRGLAPSARVPRPGRGLANVTARVEKIGGRVAWQDRPGGGTRVRLTIPLGGERGGA